MTGEMAPLERVQVLTGYRFRNLDLLVQAMTHRSFANEHQVPDNERFEFLGDAVLHIIVSLFLVERFPTYEPGKLTDWRQSIECQTYLARSARDWGLDKALRLGRGERLTRGDKKEKILENAFEALIGAVHQDGGLEACRAVLVPWLEVVALEEPEERHSNFKTALQERIQASGGPTPRYTLVESGGLDHEKWFRVAVFVGERSLGEGTGSKKQKAQQEAARVALESMDRLGH